MKKMITQRPENFFEAGRSHSEFQRTVTDRREEETRVPAEGDKKVGRSLRTHRKTFASLAAAAINRTRVAVRR